MSSLLQDIRYALRLLLKKPGFTAIAVFTLALGIGANSAIFTVVNAVLLRPLPLNEPDRLVAVRETEPGTGAENTVSDANFLAFEERNQVFDDMAAFTNWSFNLTGGGTPEHMDGAQVTAGFFSTLGVEPVLGRAFLPGEDREGRNLVVVLSHGLWQRRFASDPGIVGQTLTIDDQPITVVGVMPAGFKFPHIGVELWKPIAFNPADPSNNRIYQAMARLKPGVPIEQAQAQMELLSDQLRQERPDQNRGRGISLISLHEQIVGDIRPAFIVLVGAVGFVLLIACTNVANLMLARGLGRAKEIAIRMALGANRRRIIRQLLTESVLLALMGGVLGLLFATWGVKYLVSMSPADLPRLGEVTIDGWVLALLLLTSVLIGIIFGLVPAIQVSKPDLNSALKDGGRGSSEGAGKLRVRSLLVVTEVALSLMLLIGAGLMIRSFARLQSVDPGFDPKNVLTMPIWLSPTKYEEPGQQAAFAKQVVERVEALPGIESAGAAMFLPLGGAEANTSITVEGAPVLSGGEALKVALNIVSPGYLEAMRIQLLTGRGFDERDNKQSPDVALVSQTMARRLWPGEDAVGKRFKFGQADSDNPWTAVVGVVGDVRPVSLQKEPGNGVYLPYLQSPLAMPIMALVIRSDSDPAGLTTAIRDEVWAVDKDQPVFDIKTMGERVYDSMSQPRFHLLLLSAFAGVALLLAAIGVYGVISYSVRQRTHEIGIRMALGAKPGDVLRMVVGQAEAMALAGIGLGLVGALAVTRLMESLLYGVSVTDPLTFVVIPLLLAGVAALASYIPARRAMKVDPMVALRHE